MKLLPLSGAVPGITQLQIQNSAKTLQMFLLNIAESSAYLPRVVLLVNIVHRLPNHPYSCHA